MRRIPALSLPTSCRTYMALCAAVLVLCSAAAAQEVPRVKKNLTRADRASWRAVLRWPEACEEAYEASYPEGEAYGGLEFHRLSRGRYLVEVVCDGGGIQPGAVFMLYDAGQTGRARPLRLEGFEDETEVRALK